MLDVLFTKEAPDGVMVQFQVLGLPKEASVSCTVAPWHGVGLSTENAACTLAVCAKALEVNKPLPYVAAATILSDDRYCNMSTRTLAKPLLLGAQVGVVANKLEVAHVPSSVAKRASFGLVGCINAQRMGMSGRFASLLTQVVPPSVVIQTEFTP